MRSKNSLFHTNFTMKHFCSNVINTLRVTSFGIFDIDFEYKYKEFE